MSNAIRGPPGRGKPNHDHNAGNGKQEFVMPMVPQQMGYPMPGHMPVAPNQYTQYMPAQPAHAQQYQPGGYYQQPPMQQHRPAAQNYYRSGQEFQTQQHQPYMYQPSYQDQPIYQQPPPNQQPQTSALPAPERKRLILEIVDPNTHQKVEIGNKQTAAAASTAPAPAAAVPASTEAAEKNRQFERDFMDNIKKDFNNDSKSPNAAPAAAPAPTTAATAPEVPTNFSVPPPNFGQSPPANIQAFVPKAQRAPEPQPAETAPAQEEPKTPPVALDVQVKCSPAETATSGASETVSLTPERAAPKKEDSKEEAEDDKFDESASQCDESSATPEQGSVEPTIEKTPEELAQEKAQKEAEIAEKRKKHEEALEGRISTCLNTGEADIRKGMYCREFMMTVREYEQAFHRTQCPLSPKELNDFGLDIKSMRPPSDKTKPNFNPNWMANKGNRQQNNAYRGRTTTDGTGRGAGPPRDRQNHKRPPVVRPSIERVQRVTLPSSKDAWKPDRQRTAEDISEEEAAVKEVCKKVRALMNKVTPTSQNALTKEFISYNVSSNDAQLSEVVEIVFDKAVEEPKFCSLYAEICKSQVDHELSQPESQSKSLFRNKVLTRTQMTFQEKKDYDEGRMAIIAKEEDPEKRKLLEIEERQKFRRRKFGVMTFIGYLFRNQLLSTKIVHACVYELCGSILPKKENDKDLPLKSEDIDEESVHCALQLMETVGNLLDKTTKDGGNVVFLDQWLEKLIAAKPFCTNKIRFMIMNLVELRSNKWVPRKSVETGPKKISEIHNEIKQEKVENEKARDQYDRDRDRRHGGVRTNSNSLRKNVPVSRNSLERKGYQQPDQKRAAAAANTKLASSNVQPKNISLSGMNDTTLGGVKKGWQTGASGGGNAASEAPTKNAWNRRDSNDQRKRSTMDDKAAAIAAVKEMGSMSLSARRSGSQNSIPDTEEVLDDEQKEKREKIMGRIDGDIKEVLAGDSTILDVIDTIKKTVGDERVAKPSLTAVYMMIMRGVVEKAMKDDARRNLAYVLRLSLSTKNEKQAFLDGVSNFCKYAVEVEMWQDYPKLWAYTSEVLVNVMHVPPDVIGETTCELLSLNDFAPCFLAAKLKEQPKKKYELFVKVLIELVKYELNETKEINAIPWEFKELNFLKEVEKDGLKDELSAVTMDCGKTLADILYKS